MTGSPRARYSRVFSGDASDIPFEFTRHEHGTCRTSQQPPAGQTREAPPPRRHEAELREVVGIDLEDGRMAVDDPEQTRVEERVARVDDGGAPREERGGEPFT